MTLSPTKSEDCVSVVVEDDDAVELSENLMISLSQTGQLDRLKIVKETTVLITDDDGNVYIFGPLELLHIICVLQYSGCNRVGAEEHRSRWSR